MMHIIERIVGNLLREEEPAKKRISIRPHEYRGKQGFLVSVAGTGGGIWGTRVFAKTRDGAEKIKAAWLRGDNAEVDRILLAGG